MKTIVRFGLLAALLSCASLASLATGLPAQYANTPTAKDYPAADALVLSESRHFTLLPDGRINQHVLIVQKVLTYQGMDEIGDPKIAFNKDNQDLVISRCRTYTPEGAVVDAKANSFNEMTPFALEKAPAYTGWREMVVTKVGLDLNAVIELEYTLSDKKPWRRFLEGVVPMRDVYPALVREVSVTVPAGTALNHKLLNDASEAAVKTEGGRTTTAWTLRNIPLARMNHPSPEERAFLPTVVFTTAPDWGHQAALVGGLVQMATADTSPALDKKAADLLAGLKDPFEKIIKLHDFVAEDINTVDWPLGDFDFVPRGAAQVYDSGYGNALDKAVLLVALLNKAGVKAAIAAGRRVPEGLVDPTTVPCLSQMDGVVLHVDMGKGPTLWLDPCAPLSKRSQRDFQGFKGLPLLKEYGEIHTMVPLETADQLSANLEVKLAADLSFEGSGQVSLGGEYSPFYKVQGSKDAQKKLLDGFLSALLPGASLSEFSVVRMDPGSTVFDVSFKAPAPAKGTVKVLKTGLPEGSMLRNIPGLFLQDRDLPLFLHHAANEKVFLRFKIAEGLKPVYFTSAVKGEAACGAVTQAWNLKEGALEMELEIAVPKGVVSAADYPSFRKLATLAQAQSNRTVVFE
jgi:hypothetical protein